MTPDNLDTLLSRWLAPVSDDLPELYAVGGAVRDHLMGRPLHDMDLACRDAAGFARLLADCQDTPATVVSFTRDRQAPCYRVVDSRRPEDYVDVVNLRGPTIESDLTLRDFTVNAMAVRIVPGGLAGELVDCLNGRRDIDRRLIRVCASEALASDPLRLLRAARLAAQLDFTIAPETIALMEKNAERLAAVAPERITAELFKLLVCPRSLPLIRLLDRTGVLAVILPEVTATKGCRQNDYHHLDVWGHSLETLAACENLILAPETVFDRAGEAVREALGRNDHLPLLKLAALLHDAAKPRVKKPDPDRGRIVFHGHDQHGAVMIADTAMRLRLSTAQGNLLSLLVRHHMRPVRLSRSDVREATVIKWFRELGDAALLIMLLAVADVTAKSGEKTLPEDKERFFAWSRQAAINYVEHLKKTFSRQNLISGADLIALGLAPGPAMGRLLAKIREKQDLGELAGREEALALAEKMVKNEAVKGH